MNTVSRMDYQSMISAIKSDTSYKWRIEEWSLVCNYSKGRIISPKFSLNNVEGIECTLEISNQDYRMIEDVRVRFHQAVQYPAMHATISIVDNEWDEISTNRSSVTNTEIILYFCEKDSVNISKYLERKDTLVLLFQLTIVTDIKRSDVYVDTFDAKYGTVVSPSFKYIFGNVKEFFDITFNVQGRLFEMHKLVLVANSEVFREILRPSNVEQLRQHRSYLSGINVTVFEIFVRYMYTGEVIKIDNKQIDVNHLIRLAGEYKVMELKRICVKYLNHSISEMDALDRRVDSLLSTLD